MAGALPGPGSVVLLGATSDIGSALITRLCPGREVFLAARRPTATAACAEACRAAGATRVHTLAFEATDPASIDAVLDAAFAQGPVACVIPAFGILGDHAAAEADPAHARQILNVDFTAQVTCLLSAARRALVQSTPVVLVAFSSIAGFRARRANYIYGSTKAGLDAFAQGLADRLHGTKVSVVVARPGFVIGSMTEGMTPAPLSSTPEQVAAALAPHMARGRSATVWIPGRLRLLAAVMACVPRPLWRHTPR
ncbi:oxidoreductase [Corynebacterium sp. 13CS0277]|uniref:SDR family NAD(P)-dependent oxidoreductase n=1 Tax=Corynebacterium sp. 13CS0277 TaxID=2071994 RepID=UPI000D045096|nr:SDR family NAD(P)-dependent oxidoreductase [Corynebacterium sp. 13CS0277]PRQ12113.1 oxidoreductase [Corynebacterium sp. 13CS0277]